MVLAVKNKPASAGDVRVRSLGGEDPLEEGVETHSSVLAWRIPMGGENPHGPGESPWAGESVGLQSLRVLKSWE